MSTAAKKSLSEDKKSKAWIIVLILVLLLIGLIITLLFWPQPAPVEIPPTIIDQTSTVYVEDDTMWNPDAVIEDNNQILEMKFGF